MPKPEDINLEGIEDEVSPETLKELLTVDTDLWKNEVTDIKGFFDQVGEGKLPTELSDCLNTLEANLNK
jgi:phosphoenolpyruvate carboxykinase (GTP)